MPALITSVPSRPRPAGLVAAVVSLVLVLAGCSGGHTDRHTVTAALVNGKAGFEPATVTVHTGDKVDLRVRNTTDRPHGFDIDGYGLKAQVIQPDAEPVRVRFTARRAGTFRIFCQLHPTHQAATLVVE